MNTAELYAELQIMEWFVSKLRNEITQLENCAPDGQYASESYDEYKLRCSRFEAKEGKQAYKLRDEKYAIQDIIDRIKSDLTKTIINKYSTPNDIYSVSEEPTN